MKDLTAEILLRIGAVEFRPENPFTYASGLKGPIYCDNRKLLSYPVERKKIVKFFIEKIENISESYDYLAGLATAGIPHASFIAHELEKPMLYVRGKPKSHGKGNQIEGDYKAGEKLVLVEDLINQGSSLDEAMAGVEEAGLKGICCVAIVDYGSLKSKSISKKWQLPLHSLTDFDTLCETAFKMGLIKSIEQEALYSWREDPKLWSENKN